MKWGLGGLRKSGFVGWFHDDCLATPHKSYGYRDKWCLWEDFSPDTRLCIILIHSLKHGGQVGMVGFSWGGFVIFVKISNHTVLTQQQAWLKCTRPRCWDTSEGLPTAGCVGKQGGHFVNRSSPWAQMSPSGNSVQLVCFNESLYLIILPFKTFCYGERKTCVFVYNIYVCKYSIYAYICIYKLIQDKYIWKNKKCKKPSCTYCAASATLTFFLSPFLFCFLFFTQYFR